MSRYLFLVPPLVGHILPAAAVAQALTEHGHEVAWSGSRARLRPWLGPDAMIYPTRLPLFHAQGKPDMGMTAIKALWEGFVVPFARFMLPEAEKAVAAFRPDVLVTDHQALAGALVAERHGLRWAAMSTAPLDLGRPFQGLPKVEAWIRGQQAALAAEAGLPSDPDRDLMRSPHLMIYFFDRALVDDHPYPSHFVFVGSSTGTRPAVPGFPWEWLDPARRHVLVTVGTITDAHASGFSGRAIEALRPLGDRVQAIVVAPPEVVPDVPEHVLVQSRVPMLELMPRLDAVVCHAGMGTVSEALAHGVPLVVAPIARDTPITASHVARIGAGIRVPFRRVSPDALRAAIVTVLSDPAYRAAAAKIRDSSASAGGAAAAAARLEQLALHPSSSEIFRGHCEGTSSGCMSVLSGLH
jgi:zeaxanthin glucosyltransferase